MNPTSATPPAPSPWSPPSFGYPERHFLYEDKRAERDRYRRNAAKNPVKPRNKQQAKTACRRIILTAELFGEDRIAFFTLTLPAGATMDYAMSCFRAATAYLKTEFPDGWVRVVGISKSGVFHFHLVVVVPFNVREGFNNEAYEESRTLSRSGKLSREEWGRMRLLTRSITTNESLKALWKRLRKKLPSFGFANRVELTPIRKSPEAMAYYLVENFYGSIRLADRPKGTRLLAYTLNFPKVPPLPKTPAQLEFAERRDKLITALGLTRVTMKQRYGARWHFRLMCAMDEIDVIRMEEGEDFWSAFARQARDILEPPPACWCPSPPCGGSSLLEDVMFAAERSLP